MKVCTLLYKKEVISRLSNHISLVPPFSILQTEKRNESHTFQISKDINRAIMNTVFPRIVSAGTIHF